MTSCSLIFPKVKFNYFTLYQLYTLYKTKSHNYISLSQGELCKVEMTYYRSVPGLDLWNAPILLRHMISTPHLFRQLMILIRSCLVEMSSRCHPELHLYSTLFHGTGVLLTSSQPYTLRCHSLIVRFSPRAPVALRPYELLDPRVLMSSTLATWLFGIAWPSFCFQSTHD